MLRNTLWKDAILNARHLWGIIPWFAWVAYAVREPNTGRMLAVAAAFVGSLMAATVAAREDKLGATATLASLPVTRRTLVQGRYVMSYLVGATTFVIAATMAAVLPWSVQRGADVFELRTVLLAATLASVLVACILPLVLRFGLLGVVVLLGGLQLLGLVALAGFELFGARQGANRVFGAVERSVIALHASLGHQAPAIETAVIVSIVVWLSFRTSVFLAERRDL